VVEHAGTRYGHIEKEQRRHGEREARVLYDSACHGRLSTGVLEPWRVSALEKTRRV
jgi:hypothetical protein